MPACLADACRIEFSGAALQRLDALSRVEKALLEEMLGEIVAAVGASAPSAGRAPASLAPSAQELLSLQVGRATVRYTVDARRGLLTVKHILAPRAMPFAVVWSEQAGVQMAAIHPEIREHLRKQMALVAMAGAEARVAAGFRNSPPRGLVWSFEGHEVQYSLDEGRSTLTVGQVIRPGVRSAG